MTKIVDLPEAEFVLSGNRACAGCSLAMACAPSPRRSTAA